MRKIKQSLFWVFVYNALGIPAAASVSSIRSPWEQSWR
jgi:cation transport ATPase